MDYRLCRLAEFQNIIKAMDENILKKWLASANAHFRAKEQLLAYKPDPLNLKVDRSNGFAKNLIRLANKTLIGLNRIHLSRWKIFAGVSGLALGYFCSEFQQFYFLARSTYRPLVKEAVIHGILHNSDIKKTLMNSLLENVFTNKDVQYSLHELLDWKAIRPQQAALFSLSKQAILRALSDDQLRTNCAVALAAELQSNQAKIGGFVLQFLGGDQLLSIVQKQLSSFFRSQTFYSLLSRELTSVARSGLSSGPNRQGLYSFCREQLVSW